MKISHHEAKLFSGLFANFDLSVVHLQLIIFSDFSNYNNRGNHAVSTANRSKYYHVKGEPSKGTSAPLFNVKSHEKSKFSTFSYFNIVIDERLLKNEELYNFRALKNERIITGSPLMELNEHRDSIKDGITLSSKSNSTVD